MILTQMIFEVEGLACVLENGVWVSHVFQKKWERVKEASTWAEKILLLFCRDKLSVARVDESGPDHSLSQLMKSFPSFMQHIQGKSVLDFGCGQGHQLFAMVKKGAARATGIDTNLSAIQWPQEFDRSKILFKHKLEIWDKGQYDLVISQNSMEHFRDPERILQIMLDALKPQGKLLITFGPPWYAPYGSHMQYFTQLPWVNILFSEKTVMNVRRNFRNDGAQRYEDVTSGLNKMTVGKFERLLRERSCDVEYRLYEGVKGLHFLCAIPYIRELFVNRISVVVVKRPLS